jgi:hypothetical protein
MTPLTRQFVAPEPGAPRAVLRDMRLSGAWTSAVPVAAGRDETIPRTFLALGDLAALAIALVASSLIAPWVEWLLLPSGPIRRRSRPG